MNRRSIAAFPDKRNNSTLARKKSLSRSAAAASQGLRCRKLLLLSEPELPEFLELG
jgi:hypothetical protein